VAGLAREKECLVTCRALILAGSRQGEADALAMSEGVSHKALIELEGLPLLARVHAALAAAGIERIAVCADNPEVIALAERLGAAVIAPANGPSGSVAHAFAQLGPPMVVTTADHALLRPRWVRHFVEKTPAEADVAIMLARRAAVEAAMPGTRRTWLHFADGEWSGCNLFHLATPRAAAAIESWIGVEADRKHPWRIAARFGFGTLWNYWRGRLTMGGAIALLGKRIGIVAAVVTAPDGLAAVDADTARDLADIRALVAERRAGAGL
jgi:GTP:adenosylcobinamide-phosphate guanylyltransferase